MILENELNIIIDNPVELEREEEKISKKKAKDLFETGYLNTYEGYATFKIDEL